MRQAPLAHLYWHFLLYQNHLDRAATTHEQQGKDGRWLRDHFQQRLGFANSQFATVRETAQRLEPKLKDIEARAKVIVDADRAWAGVTLRSDHVGAAGGAAVGVAAEHPAVPRAPVVAPTGGLRKATQRRPGWTQLKELQKEHEAVIQQEVSNLRTSLGPETAAKLDNFLQTNWARNVTSIRFQPRFQRPSTTPLQVPPEVRR